MLSWVLQLVGIVAVVACIVLAGRNQGLNIYICKALQERYMTLGLFPQLQL